MSVARAMREISAPEFAEWVAWYLLEDERSDPDRTPSPDELEAKMRGWASAAGARPGSVMQVPR